MSFALLIPRPLSGELKEVHELDLVTLAVPVRSDEGRDVPAGATGTVVGIWAGGSGFEVEFLEPFEALATIRPGQIAIHQPYSA